MVEFVLGMAVATSILLVMYSYRSKIRFKLVLLVPEIIADQHQVSLSTGHNHAIWCFKGDQVILHAFLVPSQHPAWVVCLNPPGSRQALIKSLNDEWQGWALRITENTPRDILEGVQYGPEGIIGSAQIELPEELSETLGNLVNFPTEVLVSAGGAEVHQPVKKKRRRKKKK